MLVKKKFRKIIGSGICQKVRDIEGWYLFGLIPLYVRVINIK